MIWRLSSVCKGISKTTSHVLANLNIMYIIVALMGTDVSNRLSSWPFQKDFLNPYAIHESISYEEDSV